MVLGGCRKLTLYPNGCSDCISHVSIQISLLDSKPKALDWESPLFKFTVVLVNQKRRSLSREIGELVLLFPSLLLSFSLNRFPRIDAECYKRFSCEKLNKILAYHTPVCDAFDPKIGYLKDDSLLVEATVQVEQ